jgi:hypothetical protein
MPKKQARSGYYRGAGRSVVHALRWFDRRPACGAPVKNIVPTTQNVTCARCKRTRIMELSR